MTEVFVEQPLALHGPANDIGYFIDDSDLSCLENLIQPLIKEGTLEVEGTRGFIYPFNKAGTMEVEELGALLMTQILFTSGCIDDIPLGPDLP